MSKTDQFWQYAKEEILATSDAKPDENEQGLLELARIWTQAALLERASLVGDENPARGFARLQLLACGQPSPIGPT
jgi:hypothetical protein